MFKRSIPALLLILLLALTLTVPARGAEEEDYIFRLRPEAVLPAEADVRPVFEPEGVYCTGDPALLRELEAAGALEYAEENETVTLFDYDEDLAALESEPWARAMLGTGYARRAGITGGYEEPLPVVTEETEGGPETKRGVRVGLIDSGLWPGFDDCTEAAVLPGTNYTVTEDDPNRSNTEDTAGHGTFVASVLASRAVGLAPNVEIVPLKCFTGRDGNVDDLVAAIYDAVETYHCDVLNLSLGTTQEFRTIQDAVEYACQHGVILVAACGNRRETTVSNGNDAVYYPGAYDGVISVGSVTKTKTVARHSSQNAAVDVVAPGEEVTGLTRVSSGGTVTWQFAAGKGTSYAAPAVSAAAALALSADPALTPDRFRALLTGTAEDLGAPGRDNACGHGLLNLGLLLAELTEDGESMIPSWYDGTLCLSHWQPEAEDTETWFARYRADGRFVSLEKLTAGRLNNRPVTPDAPAAKLMTVDPVTFTPVRAAVGYGR